MDIIVFVSNIIEKKRVFVQIFGQSSTLELLHIIVSFL